MKKKKMKKFEGGKGMSSVCTCKPRSDEEREKEMDIYILMPAARHDHHGIHYLFTFTKQKKSILVNRKTE